MIIFGALLVGFNRIILNLFFVFISICKRPKIHYSLYEMLTMTTSWNMITRSVDATYNYAQWVLEQNARSNEYILVVFFFLYSSSSIWFFVIVERTDTSNR